MNKILYKILVFLPCLLVLCSSCTDDSDRPWYQDVEALESCYLAAVRDAEEALPQEICCTLPAIVSPDSLDDLRQQWMVSADGKAFVLVGSMMSSAEAEGYPAPSDELFTMDGRMPWVTLPYDLADHLLERLPVCSDSLECRMRLLDFRPLAITIASPFSTRRRMGFSVRLPITRRPITKRSWTFRPLPRRITASGSKKTGSSPTFRIRLTRGHAWGTPTTGTAAQVATSVPGNSLSGREQLSG